jgi:uncharacterized protein YjbI with pentapeptide repeats
MNRHVQPTSPEIVSSQEDLRAGYNPEHERILRLGADTWNNWRLENPEVWPLLMGADLRTLNLANYDLHFASLQHANLTGVDLTEAWLSSAHFEQANLSEAKLYSAFAEWACFTAANMGKCFAMEANFTKANFQQVSARAAHFADAIFQGAILPGANLSEAYLASTDFTGAWLESADLTGATLSQTHFIDCDLTDAVGLKECQHSSHSFIDFRTLQQCRRYLPHEFLKGCGLSDVVIEYIPSLFDGAINYYSCFLSHSHADKDFARLLYSKLQERDIRCWLDEHQLLPGDDPHDRIQQGIKFWDKFILCCSKHSLTSWWVDSELNRAFAKEQTLTRERGRKVLALIPLDLDGHLFSGEWASGKAEEVKSRMVADVTDWRVNGAKFEAEFQRLILALRSDDAARERPPTPKL